MGGLDNEEMAEQVCGDEESAMKRWGNDNGERGRARGNKRGERKDT